MTDEHEPSDGLDAMRSELAAANSRADAAESKLRTHLTDAGLEQAARNAKAFNPNQVATLLKPRAKLEPAVDANGKPTGEFTLSIEDDGKRTTPREAIDRLKSEAPNLFLRLEDLQGADDRKLANESPTERAARLARTSPEQYRAERVRLLGVPKRYGV